MDELADIQYSKPIDKYMHLRDMRIDEHRGAYDYFR